MENQMEEKMDTEMEPEWLIGGPGFPRGVPFWCYHTEDYSCWGSIWGAPQC